MLSTREPRISSTTLKTRLKLSNCRTVRGGGNSAQGSSLRHEHLASDNQPLKS